MTSPNMRPFILSHFEDLPPPGDPSVSPPEIKRFGGMFRSVLILKVYSLQLHSRVQVGIKNIHHQIHQDKIVARMKTAAWTTG